MGNYLLSSTVLKRELCRVIWTDGGGDLLEIERNIQVAEDPKKITLKYDGQEITFSERDRVLCLDDVSQRMSDIFVIRKPFNIELARNVSSIHAL